MKYIILVALIAIYSSATAQIAKPWEKKEKRLPTLIVPKNGQPYFESNPITPALPKSQPMPLGPQAKLLNTLENGSMVYALPQDNMPCVVPNMNGFSMPNGSKITIQPYRYNGPGAIPNPAQPIMKQPIKKK